MKILKLGKEKGCELAGEWCKAITNHLYYIATNTTEGNSELIMAKWLSLDNHLHNIHKGHGKLFPKCGHGRLGKRRIKSKKWLNAGNFEI